MIKGIAVCREVDIKPKIAESDDDQESSPKETSSESSQAIDSSSIAVSPQYKSNKDRQIEESIRHSRRTLPQRSLSTITTLIEGTDSDESLDESSDDIPICALPPYKRRRPNPTIISKMQI